MRALKLSPLSLSLPFLAFTPVFMILTGRLILGETIGLSGVLGILLIVLGAYVLNLSKMKSGLLGPIRAVLREPGSWIMLLVSFIYSITAPIGKVAILHSNPWFFAAVYNLVLSVVIVSLWPVAAGGAGVRGTFSKPGPMLLIGLMAAMENFAHMMAIAQVEAAYMIAVKRLSLLFGVLYGAWWFGEAEHPRATGRRRHHDRGRVPDPLGTGGVKSHKPQAASLKPQGKKIPLFPPL